MTDVSYEDMVRYIDGRLSTMSAWIEENRTRLNEHDTYHRQVIEAALVAAKQANRTVYTSIISTVASLSAVAAVIFAVVNHH